MTEGNPGSTGYAAFEARMRDRRFARCIERVNASLEAGTLAEVRDALDEARILCPDAPEIAQLDARIAALPSPSEVVLASTASLQEPPAGWMRVLGAMCILVLLFGLFGFGLAQLYLTEPVTLLSDRTKSTAPADGLGPPIADASSTATAPPPRNASEPIGTSSRPAASTPAVPPAAAPAAAPAPARTPVAPPPRSSSVAPAPAPAPTRSSTTAPTAPKTTAMTTRDSTMPRATPPSTAPTTSTVPKPDSKPDPKPAPGVTTAPPPPAVPPPAVNAVSRTSPSTAVTDPVLPLEAPVLSAAAAPPRVVPASLSREDESAQIRSLLSRYETAYNRLDSAAATSVWPGVDQAALDRAFRGLISQRVSLGLCDITVVGDIGGASCSGKARWEPRIGGGLQTADRYWTFNLRKGNEGWRIEQIRVR